MKKNYLKERVETNEKIKELSKEVITAKLQNKPFSIIRGMLRQLDKLFNDKNQRNET